jgi:branched-chain amino acid transport system substrate-binding protein
MNFRFTDHRDSCFDAWSDQCSSIRFKQMPTGGVMKVNRRKAVFAAVSLAIAGVAASLPGLAQAQANQPFKIGFLASMTGSAAQSGFNGIAGVNLAVKEINARGGIMGRQVQVVIADDQSDPTAAVNEARRISSRDKVDAVVGPIASQLTLATLPVLTEAKIPSVSVSGSSAITPTVGPYHFSILPSSDAQAEAIAVHISQIMKVKSAAVIHDAGAQTRSTVEALKTELGKRGIELKGVQEYALTATDLTPQLLTLRRGNPDVLLALTATGTDTGYIIKQRLEIGWPIKIVGNITVIAQPPVTVKVAGPDAYKDAIGINFKSLTYCSNDPIGSSEFAKFKARLQAEVGDKFPQYSPVVVGYLYDAVYVLKAAVEGSKKTDGPSVAEWMEKNANTVKVVNGELFASKTNHFMIGAAALTMAENPDKPRSDGMQKRAGC